MYLVIAEKPSVSRAIAEVIGAQEREDGYLRGTDCNFPVFRDDREIFISPLVKFLIVGIRRNILGQMSETPADHTVGSS